MNNNHSNKSDNQAPQGYRVVPAATGKLWLEEAWQFFRRQTRVLMFAVLLLVFIWSLSSVPVLGMVISILSPIFTAGLLLGIRAGFIKPPARINLLDAWQLPEVRKELVFLGLALTLIGLLINHLLGSDLAKLDEMRLVMASGTVPEIPMEALQRVLLFSLASIVIIGFCTWFALPEIVYRGRPALSAVLLSLQATLANWRALSVLGLWLMLLWVTVVFVVSIVSAVLLTMLGSSLIGTFIASLPVLVVSLGLMALMYVVQYVCWRDIFADPAEESPSSGEDTQIDHNQDDENTRVII
ncbi:MAG: hypothetical protein L3J22_03865 [Xanthomonadales bacterium]|nr:hypothetical protein [Xanthomonadales bacterium]